MNCHSAALNENGSAGGSIALVGHPNVGKSVLFQLLTGQRVMVSNYPGTTVEISRGAMRALPGLTLVDTPGVITFPPFSEDEVVTARVLLQEPLRAIVQVGDAKNLRRTLLLSLQLAEMGRPFVLALNMMDEARALGVNLDVDRLSKELCSAVVQTTAVRGQGIDLLTEAVRVSNTCDYFTKYPEVVETAVCKFCQAVEPGLAVAAPIDLRALALLWLSGDHVSLEWLQAHLDSSLFAGLEQERKIIGDMGGLIQATRLEKVESLAAAVMIDSGHAGASLSVRLSAWTTHSVLGWAILAIVLYGLYWFVGVFGAGTLVGLLEENLFGTVLNPWVIRFVEDIAPAPWIAELIIGEYGVWTMGMTYALALILPIVTTFFLAFSILEDSGYLPRLAALSNRGFRVLGLNGKAVLPMVLGLGCVTMAMLTTRVLESKRERLLVTLLLALAVPCSAQLGVVMGMLAGISLAATMIWSGVVLMVLLIVGWLAARLVPGERNLLLVELPPLRLPQVSNVVIKTLARLEWYLKEVMPLFLLGALLMFGLDKSGILDAIIRLGEPLVSGWLGLPPEASAAFVMGFLRRDFGATGLFVMESQGLLTPLQVLVAMVTITLFVPCIASVMMIAKERDNKTAIGMVILITPLAMLIGGLLHRALLIIGWGG